MDTNFNHEQSLSLINEMIIRARNNVKLGKAYSLIFIGYWTAVLSITYYVLSHTLHKPDQSAWIWSLMIPACVVLYFIERHEKRKTLVKTHIDKIAGMVWLGYFISFLVFELIFHIIINNFENLGFFRLHTPIIMIMVGTGHFIMACVFRQKMWYVITAATWAGAVLCAFLDWDIQFIVLGVWFILCFAAPGHILNHQAKNSHV